MATSDEIDREARSIMGATYAVSDGRSIPTPEDIPYGHVGKRFKAAVLSIDIRNSSGLLSRGDLQAGKIHKAFLRVCSQTVINFDGQIRSFNGDGLLALWPAFNKEDLTLPVRAALGIKWLIAVQLKDVFVQKYAFDFGIGLSWGEVTALRAGVQRVDGGNDLLFLDHSINQAVVISKQARAQNHVECTLNFYGNLTKQAMHDGNGNNMWSDGVVQWKNGNFKSKLTSHHWPF